MELRDQIKHENKKMPPTTTVVQFFLCRKRTRYFDDELESAKKPDDSRKAKKQSKKSNEQFLSVLSRRRCRRCAALNGGTCGRMFQLKTPFLGLTAYAKVRNETLAVDVNEKVKFFSICSLKKSLHCFT